MSERDAKGQILPNPNRIGSRQRKTEHFKRKPMLNMDTILAKSVGLAQTRDFKAVKLIPNRMWSIRAAVIEQLQERLNALEEQANGRHQVA